jgi:hypothetical protein
MTTEPVEFTVPDVLNAAADLLEEKGWTQKVAEDSQGRHCLVGALDYAARDLPGAVKTFDDALEAVQQRLPGGWVVNWNDTPGRTAEQVIALLRRVAAEETETSTPIGE